MKLKIFRGLSRFSFFYLFLSVFFLLTPAFAKEKLILAHFNHDIETLNAEDGGVSYVNGSGYQFGAWNKDPNDVSQGCKIEFAKQDAVGAGKSLELIYDVDSPFPAFNGFYFKLNGLDLTSYDTLHFYLKRKDNGGTTSGIKIEFKNAHQEHEKTQKDQKLDHSPYLPQFTSAIYLDGIKDRWQKQSIPLKDFKRIHNWTDMHELVIIFDDVKTQPKAGILYLDHITVSKKN